MDLKQWFLSMTMVATSYMLFSFENFSRPPSATLIPCQVVGGVPSPKPGDRPALHTPLDKRPHCKRGSSQQNLKCSICSYLKALLIQGKKTEIVSRTFEMKFLGLVFCALKIPNFLRTTCVVMSSNILLFRVLSGQWECRLQQRFFHSWLVCFRCCCQNMIPFSV